MHRVWLDQTVEAFGQRNKGPHSVGKAEALGDGRLALWLTGDTAAGRTARGLLADDMLDVLLEGEPLEVWVRA